MHLKHLTDVIDTDILSELFFLYVMASLAEMGRDLIMDRTRAGLEVALQLGRKGGAQDDREQDSVGQKARGQRRAGQGRAQNLGVSVSTLYQGCPPLDRHGQVQADTPSETGLT